MAVVITELKIMPTGPDVDLDELYKQVVDTIHGFVDEKHKESEVKKEVIPVFGPISALKIMFSMDESVGDTEALEKKLEQLDNVEGVSVLSCGRALG